jgi:hypothetical protein
MKKSTFNILFYLKRNAVKANGKMPIMGRITVNGEAVQFGAKVEASPKIWDTKSGKAVGKTQEVIELNGILDSIKATMTKIYRELQERETTVKADPFANYKIRIKKVDRGYLQQEEIEAIMAKKFLTKRL